MVYGQAREEQGNDQTVEEHHHGWDEKIEEDLVAKPHYQTVEIPHEIQIEPTGEESMNLGSPAVRIEVTMVSLSYAST